MHQENTRVMRSIWLERNKSEFNNRAKHVVLFLDKLVQARSQQVKKP
jgi:hypothetical protein